MLEIFSIILQYDRTDLYHGRSLLSGVRPGRNLVLVGLCPCAKWQFSDLENVIIMVPYAQGFVFVCTRFLDLALCHNHDQLK